MMNRSCLGKEELRVRRKSLELRVSVDVGSRRHSVAIGLPNGQVLEEFEIAHGPEGFQEFFLRIEKHQKDKVWSGGSDGGLQRLCPAARHSGSPARLSALQHQQSEAGTI